MSQFRFVHISAQHSFGWFTIQRDDYFPLRWPQVKDHQKELAFLIEKETLTPDSIGQAYGQWKDWSLLPSWAIEPLESELIA